MAVAEELAVKGLTTDSKPAGTDTPAKKAVVSQKQKRSLPPGNYLVFLKIFSQFKAWFRKPSFSCELKIIYTFKKKSTN